MIKKSTLINENEKMKKMLFIWENIGIGINATVKEKEIAAKQFLDKHPEYNLYQISETIKINRGTLYNYLYNKVEKPWFVERIEELTKEVKLVFELYYEDDIVTITATPNEYYAFVNWVDNNNNVIYTEPTVTFPMSTTDIVLNAVFEQVIFEATLDVSVNNIEWGHVLINGERADRYHGHTGDTVTLVAVPYDGYHFDHWDGAHPIYDTVPGEAISIVLTEPTTDIVCHFAENVSINDVVEDNIIIYTKHNNIVVSGAEQQIIRVFDVVGRLVAQRSNANVEETIPMPATGVYLVKVGDRPARRVVVRK